MHSHRAPVLALEIDFGNNPRNLPLGKGEVGDAHAGYIHATLAVTGRSSRHGLECPSDCRRRPPGTGGHPERPVPTKRRAGVPEVIVSLNRSIPLCTHNVSELGLLADQHPAVGGATLPALPDSPVRVVEPARHSNHDGLQAIVAQARLREISHGSPPEAGGVLQPEPRRANTVKRYSAFAERIAWLTYRHAILQIKSTYRRYKS